MIGVAVGAIAIVVFVKCLKGTAEVFVKCLKGVVFVKCLKGVVFVKCLKGVVSANGICALPIRTVLPAAVRKIAGVLLMRLVQ